MPSYLTRLLLSAPVLLALASPVDAASFSNIYSFGDSLSDAGNLAAATGIPAAPYVNGHFSNGQVWVQDVAASLGLPPVTASLLGGTDYAVGGALSGSSPFHSATIGDLPSQLAAFHLANPTADPNALYTIWIGANDMNAILGTSPTPAQVAADIAAVVGNIDSAINTLASEGAKKILVLTVPDLGKSPRAIATGPVGVAAASNLSLAFDNLLVNGSGAIPSLGALGTADSVNVAVFDTYSFIDSIVANPAAFGLTDAKDQCLVGSVNYAGGTPCANPNQYLFWDDLHPTAAGHSLLASAVLATAVPEPATCALVGVGIVAALAARRKRVC